jgi:hypothetical protein
MRGTSPGLRSAAACAPAAKTRSIRTRNKNGKLRRWRSGAAVPLGRCPVDTPNIVPYFAATAATFRWQGDQARSCRSRRQTPWITIKETVDRAIRSSS